MASPNPVAVAGSNFSGVEFVVPAPASLNVGTKALLQRHQNPSLFGLVGFQIVEIRF